MKKKSLMITGGMILVVVVLALILIGTCFGSTACDEDEIQTAYPAVQLLETVSDNEESSYEVGALLSGTDFSCVGQILADKFEKEWNTYDSMTIEQRMLSSKLWGVVGLQTDTWAECEETIGFTIHNPLEDLGWLGKTGYFGMESANPDITVGHIQIIANATQGTDRELSEISATAGYNSGSARVTLTAVLSANTGTYTTGSICNGYATYEQNTVTTATGIPVLIVTTNETNNNGYYSGDYFDSTAYWVKDNVFYTLRVFGAEADKDEIQAVLERILEEI